MTTCREGCGACCSPVVLPYGPAEIAAVAARAGERERRWLLDELRPISRREGVRRRPETRGIQQGANGEFAFAWHYECSNYDAETRRCLAFEERPDVCRLYPDGYDVPLNRSVVLPASCSFRADVGLEVGPLP